ncbi:Binding-protein-dependent transport system inner membrane component [uncultured archaeon]|nr:Binding-protein-dependent transport system inner membrane component [uncultured archaeon]
MYKISRNLLFAIVISVIIATMALDQFALKEKLLPPLGYFYVFFSVFMLFYFVYPLYRNQRLTLYYWERTRKNKLAMLGLFFIVFLIILAIAGPFFTADPNYVNFEEKNLPPLGFTTSQSVYDRDTGSLRNAEIRGTWKHPLGTDDKGRDILAMIVSGARVSLQVGLVATFIALMIGTVIGVSSAYFGGAVDNVLMRFTDIMMTFPFFLLLVFIVFIFGADLTLIILIIGVTGWTGAARIVRSEALSLRTREFVLASRALGASDTRIIFRHLIPNVMGTLIVIATLSIPGVILAEAALSFIGLGDPTVASWGRILNAGQDNLETTWWVAVEPGIMLFLTVLSFNFLGDGLRDAFDPRSEL